MGACSSSSKSGSNRGTTIYGLPKTLFVNIGLSQLCFKRGALDNNYHNITLRRILA